MEVSHLQIVLLSLRKCGIDNFTSKVIVTVMLSSADTEILESDVLQRKLMYYMPLLHTELLPMEALGLDFFRYGYVTSNCGNRKYETQVLNKLYPDKKDQNVNLVVSKFYEFYILPYGDYDNTILNMFLSFLLDYQMINYNNGLFHIFQYRGCDQEVMQCHRILPMRPRDIHFSEVQCQRALLFNDEFSYRAETFALPVDYYALNIYVLTKLTLSSEDLGNVEQGEKLFEIKYFLNLYLKKSLSAYERKFINYLNYREKKQELMKKDLNDCADSDRKKYIDEELKFHKLVTNMMVQGWMINLGVSPTDGKFEMTDQQGNKHVYDVPPITDFDSTKHL